MGPNIRCFWTLTSEYNEIMIVITEKVKKGVPYLDENFMRMDMLKIE